MPSPTTKRNELRFPILTLDDQALIPALGYVFDEKWLWPYESILSILWKFSRANGVNGPIVAKLLHSAIDPYEGVEAHWNAVDLQRLRSSLGLPLRTLRESFVTPRKFSASTPMFRFCRSCLALGYHAVMYQLPTIHRCPLHNKVLETVCLHCKRETPYRLNAMILDAPYRCSQCGRQYGWQLIKSFDPIYLTPKRRTILSRQHYRHFYA